MDHARTFRVILSHLCSQHETIDHNLSARENPHLDFTDNASQYDVKRLRVLVRFK